MMFDTMTTVATYVIMNRTLFSQRFAQFNVEVEASRVRQCRCVYIRQPCTVEDLL